MQGRWHSLGGPWRYRFTYIDVPGDRWPVALEVGITDGAEVPVGGLPVRRLRQITTANDPSGRSPVTLVTPKPLPPGRVQTVYDKLRALYWYQELGTYGGKPRAEVAEWLSIADGTLKNIIAWGRRTPYGPGSAYNYFTETVRGRRGGVLTDVGIAELTRLGEGRPDAPLRVSVSIDEGD